MQVKIDSNALYEALLVPEDDSEDDSEDYGDISGIGIMTKKEDLEGSVNIPRTELPTPFDYARGSFYRRGAHYFGGVSLFLPKRPYSVSPVTPPIKRANFLGRVFRKVEPVESELPSDFFLRGLRLGLEKIYGDSYRPSKEGVSGFILDGGEPSFSIERYEEENQKEDEGSALVRRFWIQIGGSGLKRRNFKDKINFGMEVKQLSDLVTTFVNTGVEEAIEQGLIKRENTDLTLRLGPIA